MVSLDNQLKKLLSNLEWFKYSYNKIKSFSDYEWVPEYSGEKYHFDLRITNSDSFILLKNKPSDPK